MKIVHRNVTVRELTKGYKDDGDGGVIGYGGHLDIRPPYQREFVYSNQQREAVIRTIKGEFPLNVMYWADRGEGRYEIIDGQQRTISICQYVAGDFSLDDVAFHNLQADQKEHILNYKLMVYLCSGTDSERLAWFKIINIAGAKLTDQELRNAVYHGSWLTDAKRYFSRRDGPAYGLGKYYLAGSPIRQDYLETVLKWINDGKIELYMSEHQHDKTAVELWNYFRSVIDWVKETFTIYRKEMKGIGWGPLYNQFKDNDLDPAVLEEETSRLMMDDDVTNNRGIYSYLLTHEEKHLNIRAFTSAMKRAAYERQKGKCKSCKKPFDISKMEADHIDPWSKGGRTIPENCQMLCKPCNRRKSDK